MPAQQFEVRRDADNNPICIRCEEGIQNPEMHALWFDDRHPDIPLGPMCETCTPYMKVCSHCHHSFSLFEESDSREDQITMCDEGIWLCGPCKSAAKVCSNCNKLADELSDFGDYVGVCDKCLERDTFQCVECGDRNMNAANTFNSEEPLTIQKYSVVFDTSKYEQWSLPIESAKHICGKCFKKKIQGKEPQAIVQCTHCSSFFGKRGPDSELSPDYCDDCHRRGRIFKCEWCNKYHQSDSRCSIPMGYSPTDSGYICRGCSTTKFLCSGCKKIHNLHGKSGATLPTVFVRSNSPRLCNDCTSGSIVCPTCRSQVTSTKIKNHRIVCDICEPNLNFCSSCNEWHLGEGGCRNAVTDIMSYSHKPYLIPKCTKADRLISGPTLYMGFENEVSYNSGEDKRAAQSLLFTTYKPSEVIAKSDGSIRGPGFEVVTHPMTLNAFKKMSLAPLFKYKPRKHSSCGMHVHLSRSFFQSKLHIFKLVTYMNTWEKLIKLIAGRGFVGYASKIDKKISTAVLGKTSTARGSVVNLTGRDTIELRIFAGSTTAIQVKYKIEFCHAISYFTRDCSIKSKDTDFIEYVHKHKKMYPNLSSYLKKRWKS